MSKLLNSSASQIDTADPVENGCSRKWYFQKVMKLPELPRGSSTFGDCIHSVCERYQEADRQGLDADGNLVDLYPENWEHPFNRFSGKHSKESVSKEEQAVIKLLISKAISEGILLRVEGREIEKKLRFKAMDGVMINGFIDLLEPGAIRDHKSTKSMKWAKSLKKLKKNVQLNLYAYWYFTEGGYDKSLPLALSHQYFCKDPNKPHVEKREVSVTWEEVNRFWEERIVPVLETMLIYKDVKNFKEIPLPCNVSGACRRFGGCEFTRICTDLETPADFAKRINRELTGVSSTDYKTVASELGTPKKGEKKMASKMMDKIRAEQALKRGENPPEPAAVEVVAKPVAAKAVAKPKPAVKPEAADKIRAPWHKEGCNACKSSDVLGFRADRSGPCKLCAVFYKKNTGKTLEDAFTWDIGEGDITVIDNETGEEAVTEVVAEDATAKEKIEDAPPVEEKEAPPVVDKPAVETPSDAPAVLAPTGEAVFGDIENLNIRDKFTLLIGCAVVESKVKGGGKFGTPSCRVTAEEFIIIVNTEMAKIVGSTVEWLGMNKFQQRDAVSMYGEPISEALGSATLVVARLPKASLLESVILAIRPYAKEVIQALAD